MKTVNAPFTPPGGIHPPYRKEPTAGDPIQTVPLPKRLLVSLSQHLGAPSKPLVKKGDRVLRAQPIAEPAGFVSAWVHAPTSGTVKSVGPMPTASGRIAAVVEIEADGQDTLFEQPAPPDCTTLEPRQIVEVVAKAGIVGMGGAGFPTHVKLSPPPEKRIATLIINGAECEPYLTADHRLMVEQSERIWQGVILLRKALGAGSVRVAIEDNKPDAIRTMEKAMQTAEGDVELVVLETEYPQGAEKQLVYSVLGAEVPSGGLPMDVGALVENVGTVAAIADAAIRGEPLHQRVLTVTGDAIRTPRNLLARIGTPFTDLLSFCGGTTGEIGKLICGGPMMGVSQVSPEAAVGKTTSGLLILSRALTVNFAAAPCISCGRCVVACPMRLLPCTLSEAMEAENLDLAEELNVLDCIECGACAYECPARRPLVQHLRQGKSKVMTRRRHREALQKAGKKP